MMNKAKSVMRYSLSLSLVLFNLAAGPVLPSASLPPTSSNPEKLKYLSAVKEHIPNLFDNVSQFDTDLFTLLDQQRDLLEKLEKNSKYLKNAQRHPRIEIRLEPTEARTESKILFQRWVRVAFKVLPLG
jgi:hypothetical protein